MRAVIVNNSRPKVLKSVGSEIFLKPSKIEDFKLKLMQVEKRLMATKIEDLPPILAKVKESRSRIMQVHDSTELQMLLIYSLK